MTSSAVRIAGPADYDEVWRLLMLAHDEGAIFTVAEDKVRWMVHRTLYPEQIEPLDQRARGVIGVIGNVGKLEGLALLCISSMWYSYDLFIEELVVFVDHKYRKSDHAKTLIGWMKKQPDEVGLPLVSGVVANERTEGKCRFYRRELPKAGEFFLVKPKEYNTMFSIAKAS